MAGPDGGGGEQQLPSTSGGPIDEALGLGGERAEILGLEQENAESLGSLDTQREELQAAYDAELGRLEDKLHGDLGQLGDRKVELEGERDTLSGKRDTTERKVKRLGGRIRALAAKDDAPRGDQLAFAAYATGDLSPAGLENIGHIDELVVAEAGELFVVRQAQQVAFGRILPGNQGLRINTDQERRRGSIDRVHLPVKTYAVSQEDGDGVVEAPQYGWVSGGFDEYKEEHQYDLVLGRYAEATEMVDGRFRYPFSNFNLAQLDLQLLHPTRLEIVREFSGEVDAEEVLQHDSADEILTGAAADAYLHAFVGSRLAQMSRSVESEIVSRVFSRAIVAASRLGVEIDVSRIPNLEASLGD